MWKCEKCSEEIEDQFDACWKCGTSQEGVEDPGFIDLQNRNRSAFDGQVGPEGEVNVFGDGDDLRTICPDCDSELRPIIVIDNREMGDQALTYAAADAKKSWTTGRYLDRGKVSAKMCVACGRILLYGEKI